MDPVDENKNYCSATSGLSSGNSTKAGLPTSLEEINKRITEASKHSRYTAAQERKTSELELKICAQKEQLKLKMEQKNLVARTKKSSDLIIKKFEEDQKKQFRGNQETCWVCVDMDAYFAAVESLDAPELKDIPMAVGSSAMLSTANYAARKFGVSAAMPGYIAQKLCPQLKIVPLRYDRYTEINAKVAGVLSKYDEGMVMWSLDEAFLKLKRDNFIKENDKTEFNFGRIVEKMREEVQMVTGLTCSAGIASNSLLAKLASNHRKPNGQFEIERADIVLMRKFLYQEPVRKLSGIGKVMAVTLEKLFDIRTVGDLYEKRHFLGLIFKEKTVRSLLAMCIGHTEENGILDLSFHHKNQQNQNQNQNQKRKSVSCERTFQPSRGNLEKLEEILEELVKNLMEDMVNMEIVQVGKLGIKIKSSDFRVYTRETAFKWKSTRVEEEENDGNLFKGVALRIFNEFVQEMGCLEIRLLGVKLSNLKFKDDSISEPKIIQKRPATVLETWLNRKNADTDAAKCPVCRKVFQDEGDLGAINVHVDECLTINALREEKDVKI